MEGGSLCFTRVKELEGFLLHVKLMFLILCEELIRDGDSAHRVLQRF